ncbi:hypothetical protein, partial [Sulfobacillus thermosulfidooxidans]
VVRNNTLMPNSSYLWCPMLEEMSPMEIDSYLTDNFVPWQGPLPDNMDDIYAVSNKKIVKGLTLKKSGSSYFIKIKSKPVQMISVSRDKIIELTNGWFVPKTLLDNRISSRPIELNKKPYNPYNNDDKKPTHVSDDFEDFLTFIESKGLIYDFDDLVLFFAGLSAGQFVVLGGTGGIGKSSLAYAYSEFIKLKNNQSQYVWLTVEPSWVSTEQIVGYYDQQIRLFCPSATNLADLLVHAKQFPDIPHIVCLDELNLGRVEHYLAPVLSLKEHNDFSNGWTFYASSLVSQCLNANSYPPQVYLGNNVLWIGTINMDEASYALTEKFMDRVLYIPLRPVSFKKTSNLYSHVPVTESIRGPLSEELTNDEREFFDRLNSIATRPLMGWRTLKSMQKVVSMVPLYRGKRAWTREKAWDEQIASRVIAKFFGLSVELKLNMFFDRLEQYLMDSPWGTLDRSVTLLNDAYKWQEKFHGF